MGTTNFDAIKANELDAATLKRSGTEITATAVELNELHNVGAVAADFAILHGMVAYDPGKPAVAVIDFNTGAAEAGCKVTIGGVDYAEKDAPDATKGEWTNGASAADSATSFAAGVNGKTGGLWTAVRSAAGESVIIQAKTPGAGGNVEITTDSAARVTVENAHGGAAAAQRKLVIIRQAVTDQDILADEVNVPLPGAPAGWSVQCRDADGGLKAATWRAAAQTAPNRIRLVKNGATDLVATDVVEVVAYV